MRSADGPQAEQVRLEAASRWRVLGEKWADNLAELRADGKSIDLVVFTGDLGDRGHATDYPRAIAFLKQTCAALDVPIERLFVIPGNHDIDRKAHAAAWRWMRSNLEYDPRTYSEWMAGKGPRELRRSARRDQLLKRQQAFRDAVTRELGRPELDPRHSPHRRLGYRQAVRLPELSQPIHVIGLDTAWLAGDDHDSGQLRLTEHQVALLTTTQDGEPLPGFRIALMHHRLADVADAAEARRLMSDRVDLLLHGHQHEPAAEVLQGPDHQLLVLATGCLYEGDEGHRYPNACQVIDLDLDERARPRIAEVRFRGWSAHSLFWGDDALLYQNAPGGRLRLHRGKRGWSFDEDGDVRPDRAPGGEPPPSPPGRTKVPDFTIELQRHRRFLGREDVLAQLDRWLLGPGAAGWVIVTGGPGMGKSAVLAQWLARRQAAGAMVPHHLVRRQLANWDQPDVIAASLAAQIEARFPDLCDPGARPEARLIELLGRVSTRLGPSGDLVVMVDGLDETRAEPGENPLPRFLPPVVPDGIRILCAMRPTYPHLSWIEARNPARRIDLDDGRWASSNEAVVRELWEAAATEYQPPLPAEAIDAAVDRAEGNVLHAVMLHDALRGMPPPERRVDRIPRGLEALIEEVWERAASHESVRTGLGLLCAAQKALPLDVLAELAGWGYEEKRRCLREARQLLLEEPAAWAGVDAYRPRHDWVREFIAEQLGAANMRGHHATLSRRLATWPAPSEATARRYALRHALLHRTEAGAWEDAWRLAANTSFLEAQCRELGVHEAESDVARAAERCRASGDPMLHGRFDALARALGRESTWLRVAPEAVAALVWNQLRRSGWSAADIDRQLQVPAGSTFLRVQHVATRESPALVRDLVGHLSWVRACAVTPDGHRVVSASADRTLKVWDLDSGRALATLQGHASLVLGCAVTPDGRRVVSASDDKSLKVWDLDSGRTLATLHGHAGSVLGCAVAPDGRRVVSASDDHTLKVWDLDSGRTLVTLQGHSDSVRGCAVTPDGRRVVSASDDDTLKVWDLDSGHVLATLQGHSARVLACAVAPDGRRGVSASQDGTLKVWDLESGHTLATLQGHSEWVRACAVTPDGRRVVSASEDLTLKVWDLESGHTLVTLRGHAASVSACAVTPDGRRVVSASDDHTLRVWDLEAGPTLAPLQGHSAWVCACAVSPDGRHAVSASNDHTLKVWDLGSRRTLATLEGHSARVLACAVTPDGRHVVSASEDKTLKIWELESGHLLATLQGHSSWVNACAVTPDGRRVVSASEGRTLKVWDLDSGRLLATMRGHASFVLACAVAPDGRRAISASADRTLKVWDLDSGRTLATWEGHSAWVRACVVTPDGRHVISASADRTLKVWDLDSGHTLATLEGHSEWARGCAVTPDGRHVISVSDDHTLKVWDLDSCACLLTHRVSVNYTAVAATATTIIAGDAAGAIWFLDWPSSSRQRSSTRSSSSSVSITSGSPPSSS